MKKIKYDILSPDGISIHATNSYNSYNGISVHTNGYDSPADVKEAFMIWAKQYIKQGYYSSNNGRIALSELWDHCKVIKL